MKRKILIGILLFVFVYISQPTAIAQELAESLQTAPEKSEGGIRIAILTSGPAKFNSRWLDNPPRLEIKFRSKNILSKIDNEITVNQGIIKKVTSTYFERGQKRSLKSLTFELTQKVPYKIWQESDTIILDIKTPPETGFLTQPISLFGEKEIFAKKKTTGAAVKRLEAMETVLAETTKNQQPLEKFNIEVNDKTPPELDKSEKNILPDTKSFEKEKIINKKGHMLTLILWLIGLGLISGLGFLIWRRYKLSANSKLRKLKLGLEEKAKELEQEKIVRKAIEKGSLRNEKEYEQFKDSFESLKDELVKKGVVRKELSQEEKERPWIPSGSEERRAEPRLPLAKDFNRTIILKIESKEKTEVVKAFAKDISSEGLCFESKKDFNEKDQLKLRLFFYGAQIPMMKIQAHIIWKKKTKPMGYYGVYFDFLEDKDKIELANYVQSNIANDKT